MTLAAVEPAAHERPSSSTAFSTATSQDVRPETPASLKRKRGADEATAADLRDIHIHPYPGSIYDKPLLLKPLRLIPRSRVPLTFLDTSSTTEIFSRSHLFTANIDALEDETAEQKEPQVVIANLNDEPNLYAIERVKPRVYALCRLCSWVQVGYIEDVPATTTEHISKATSESGTEHWWSNAAIQRASSNPSAKRVKLTMAPPVARVEIPTAPSDLLSLPVAIEESASKSLPPQMEPDVPVLLEAQKTDEEIFETLIRQYLDAIYVSKTSLAFFVKGPLSRARNALQADGSASKVASLTAQLRLMLLSISQMDKKYKEKIPKSVKSFPAHSLSDDEVDGPIPAKKRRSKKVPKLSREGYYPIEEAYCKRWWMSNQSAVARARPDETFDQLLRRRAGDLRRRETLAQIILILEVLALESLPDFKQPREVAVESQDLESQIENNTESQEMTQTGETTKKAKRKPKKQQDLDLLLDLLLDKLSIWQSIEQEIGAALDTDKKRDTVAENSEKLLEQDILISFCVDVVIPFYKSRVPMQASLVNKKLGGPGAVSPAKHDKSKSRDGAKIAPKPGDRRSRKPLQKTLSDANAFTRSRPPSLSRSATDIQGMTRFKREASELSLFDIPLAKPSHRDSSSQLRHLQQRQVDLTAISAATESRLKHKAKIEQDLKDAINTLKRPNRGEAVRELVDAADQRSLGSASMRKKTMAPIRKVLQTSRNVQVTATPKHRRVVNALAAQKQAREEEAQEQYAPSSGDLCIPSSGVRTVNVDVIGATPAASRVQLSSAPFVVSATPSRRPLRALDDIPIPDELQATPAQGRTKGLVSTGPSSALLAVPQKSSFQDFMRSQMSRKPAATTPLKTAEKPTALDITPIKPFAIFATPAKRSLASSPPPFDNVAANTPLKAPSAQPAATTTGAVESIYDALGWNDYDDE